MHKPLPLCQKLLSFSSRPSEYMSDILKCTIMLYSPNYSHVSRTIIDLTLFVPRSTSHFVDTWKFLQLWVIFRLISFHTFVWDLLTSLVFSLLSRIQSPYATRQTYSLTADPIKGTGLHSHHEGLCKQFARSSILKREKLKVTILYPPKDYLPRITKLRMYSFSMVNTSTPSFKVAPYPCNFKWFPDP